MDFIGQFKMSNHCIVIFLSLFLISIAQIATLNRFTGRSNCEQEQFLEQLVLPFGQCIPFTKTTNTNFNYIKVSECQRQYTLVQTCKDSLCVSCDPPKRYMNDRCEQDRGEVMKKSFHCGSVREMKPNDFSFLYFHEKKCQGPSSFNIAGSHCINITPRVSWRNFCDTKTGKIRIETYRNGDCQPPFDEESQYDANKCVTWLGSLNVIFQNCTKI